MTAGRCVCARPRSTPGRSGTATLGLLEVRQLRHLPDEKARLERLLADLMLDRHILQEVI